MGTQTHRPGSWLPCGPRVQVSSGAGGVGGVVSIPRCWGQGVSSRTGGQLLPVTRQGGGSTQLSTTGTESPTFPSGVSGAVSRRWHAAPGSGGGSRPAPLPARVAHALPGTGQGLVGREKDLESKSCLGLHLHTDRPPHGPLAAQPAGLSRRCSAVGSVTPSSQGAPSPQPAFAFPLGPFCHHGGQPGEPPPALQGGLPTQPAESPSYDPHTPPVVGCLHRA